MAWNKDLPAGNTKFNVGDDVIRANQAQLESGLHNEHEFATGGVQTGIHKFTYSNKAAMDALSPVNGSISIRSDVANPGIHAYNGATWGQVATRIPASTAMVFHQAAAPSGWVADETKNDRLLHVVTVASGVGGTVHATGTWTIEEIVTDQETDDHTLTTADIPAHNHSVPDSQGSPGSGLVFLRANTGPIGDVSTGSTGDGGAHSHDLTFIDTWRPAATQVIICTKAASSA
jgi:hypothetical protein